jgi:hypothetical protein
LIFPAYGAILENRLLDMNTVAEIEAALHGLNDEEVLRIQCVIRRELIQRANNIVEDDAYGITTDRDLIASADEAFQAYDEAEAQDARGQKG